MGETRLEKIGSKSIIDKLWDEKPISVIKNPHKLTEVELYNTLQKIVEMPEKRLRNMIKNKDNNVDDVFIQNIIERIPKFLTATLVNLVKTLLLQKDMFRDHVIWKALEGEIYIRRNKLNNQQLATVIHGFGITGNGSKEFYSDFEEVIIDSPIQIETEYLVKILFGYTQIDRGSPVLYSDTVEKLILRGIENLDYIQISEISKILSKATNVHKAGFGFFETMEKYFHKEMNDNKISFEEICKIAENILPFNVGSNKFQAEVEDYILLKFSTQNLQNFADLLKGLSTYRIKKEELRDLVYQTIAREINEFTVKQLEILVWSLSRMQTNNNNNNVTVYPLYKELPESKQFAMSLLIQKIQQKSPSMKARGIAFALEAIQNIQYKNEEFFKWMEKIVISKLDEFIPHYLVKVLSCYYNMGYGSGMLYEKLCHHIIDGINKQELKYSDMLRFYEIYPQITHIYENTMSNELFQNFVVKIKEVITDKQFPTTDVCRTFNILIKINPYCSFSNKKDDEFQKIYNNFMYELVAKIRHSVFDIPKEQFTNTLSNLVEYNLPEIANKFIFIIEEVIKNRNLQQEFQSDKQKIEMFWSLIQLEKAFKNQNDIFNPKNLEFLNNVIISDLDTRTFILYKQLICLLKIYIDTESHKSQQFLDKYKQIDFNSLYQQFAKIPLNKREQFLNEDETTKTSKQSINLLQKYLKDKNYFIEIHKNFSDDLMNLIDLVASYPIIENDEQQKQLTDTQQYQQLFGIIILNKHHYIQNVNSQEKKIKRSVELKKDILEQLFDWNIKYIDEEWLLSQQNNKEIVQKIDEKLKIQEIIIKEKQMENIQKGKDNEELENGGRKIKNQKKIIKEKRN